MSGSEATNSPQVNLMLSFVEAFKERNMDLIAEHLHKDHRRLTYPRSVGKGEQTKEEYLQYTGELIALWTDSNASYSSVYH